MASVQLPPGVKHTLIPEGVVVALGGGGDCTGEEVTDEAIRGLLARQY
jgi:hypothetical protein